MVSSIKSIKALLALTEPSNLDVHFSITTPYGLVLELSGDSLQVRLAKGEEPLSLPPTPAADAEPQLPVTQAISETLSKIGEDDSVHGPLAETSPLQVHQEDPLESEDRPKSELDEQPEPQPEYGPSIPGHKYYIWPDYGTNFMWYTYGWSWNPEGGDNIDDNDLEVLVFLSQGLVRTVGDEEVKMDIYLTSA
ncbi:hypothetical protein BDP55DRAFT_679251 [Colletotrichum godetiae]|uniref:Uncharacterized protein n=1 Tax=Colletotrichum godetiae TaxID=1209918 RepID=A0AAJ0AAF0_9PEZI|nr:uncharacterized protein BDP55DRAFT_679251 [Colletotrichum godetiae]KAK1659514.1 hypothetical protein BDP55DRAFT_679251 [Colletotrichum godetiae]